MKKLKEVGFVVAFIVAALLLIPIIILGVASLYFGYKLIEFVGYLVDDYGDGMLKDLWNELLIVISDVFIDIGDLVKYLEIEL